MNSDNFTFRSLWTVLLALLTLPAAAAPPAPGSGAPHSPHPGRTLVPDSLANALAGAAQAIWDSRPSPVQTSAARESDSGSTKLASPWEFLETARGRYESLAIHWEPDTLDSGRVSIDRSDERKLTNFVRQTNREGRRSIEWVCEVVDCGNLARAGSFLDLRMRASDPSEPDGRRFVIQLPARFNALVRRLEASQCVRVLGVFQPNLTVDEHFDVPVPSGQPRIGRGVRFGFTIQVRGIEVIDPSVGNSP